MTSIYIILIFLAICLCYGLPRLRNRNDLVYSAFAGSADEPHNSENPVVVSKASKVIKLPSGLYANTNSYHRLRVNGVCMTPSNINNNEEWLAKKINKKKDLKTQIRTGDVILIYLADTKRYKIRKVANFINDTTVDTYSFNASGEIQMSSKPHSKETIMGVLQYRLSNT